jgi:L-asparaginase
MRRPAALALVALCHVAPAASQTERAAAIDVERPRVRLVATGGTISNRAGGRLTADDLVGSIPNLDRYVRVEHEQFANTASSALTLAQWLQLARRINELFHKDAGLAGIVVTSGTDTLEETAYFLQLTVLSDRPVVVTGSMRNPSTLGYEGAANLLAAFRAAAAPASRGKGVLVVLNDEINSARDVTKTDALRLQTFQARVYGALGVVDADSVAYFREPTRRHTAKSEFDVAAIVELPRVDVIMTYQGAPGDLIKAAVDHGAPW